MKKLLVSLLKAWWHIKAVMFGTCPKCGHPVEHDYYYDLKQSIDIDKGFVCANCGYSE